jgi:hypothetical protein
MNETDSSILSKIAIGVSVITAVVGVINHKRIRSNCCGKVAEASIDIENTTPPKLEIKI